MLFLLVVLTDNSMNDSLQDVFLWNHTFHIFDKVVSISGLIIFEVVNNQIESCLWNDIDERWEHLKSILSSSEHNKVVSQKIIVLEHISYSR